MIESCFACIPLSNVNVIIKKNQLFDSFHNENLEQFLNGFNASSCRDNLRYHARIPHMAGTEGDLQLAKYTVKKMKEYGLNDSEIQPVNVLLNYPKNRSLKSFDKTTKNVIYSAPLIEDILIHDPTSNTKWRNMSFLGYGASGKALGKKLVYANYGRPEDFKVLEESNVDVKDKIVIVRYGECFRGLKVMNSQNRGAAGVIIYSDPYDDGYSQGPTYPSGPWRPETSVQRGSVQFNSLCGGDPGRKNVEELCGYKTSELIPKIPALPISYGDAVPLLKTLGGPLVPKEWKGGLSNARYNITYRFGPSFDSILYDLEVENEFVHTDIYNVITTIKGEEDSPVVMGNHRDAWVYGAADPNSGSAVMMEVTKNLGNLVKKGWKPKRTIIIGSWSGEEYGLLGSTAYGEKYATTTLKNAVGYVNVDVGVSGRFLKVASSPSLSRAFTRIVKNVINPTTKTEYDWKDTIGTLGSGSDYTVFLDYLGIPSIDLRQGQDLSPTYGTYHSTMDSYTWLESEIDPEYEYHVALAQVVGLLVLDLADSKVVPINLMDLGNALEEYLKNIKHKSKNMIKFLNFTQLENAILKFKRVSTKFMHSINENSADCSNKVLGNFERTLLDPDGLLNRKWFKHILQSPGLYLGYDALVFPGIAQALLDKDIGVANQQIQRIADILEISADKLNQNQKKCSLEKLEKLVSEF